MPWINNLCRLCGEISNVCFNIIDSDYSIQDKIKRCLHLEILPDDLKPKQICNICFNKIDELNDFIEICYSTNIKFDSMCYSDPWLHRDDIKDNNIIDNNQTKSAAQFKCENDETSDGNIMILQEYDINDSGNDNLVDYSISTADTFSETNTILNKSLEEEKFDENLNNKSNDKECNNVQENKPDETIITPKKIHTCPHCRKKFHRRTNLTVHLSIHTNIKPYKCTLCMKTFAIQYQLTQHTKLHDEIYKCITCQKTFDVPSKLKRHTRIHTNEKPYQCNIDNCGKSFANKNNLKSHTDTHVDVKNFSCDICNKLFKCKKYLRSHQKSHNISAQYQCEYCQRLFKYKYNLKSHLMKTHNESSDFSSSGIKSI